MAKTLVYQIYLFGFLEKGGLKPTKFYEHGAIEEATKHLDRVKALGADAVWIGPIFHSPWHDHGYDIADYYSIEPYFGSMEDFDIFVARAHQLGIKVIIDLVLNHTSTAHEWFQHPKMRKRFYCWSPKNRRGWNNLFDSSPAWTYSKEAGEFYLHLFHETQADLNWFPRGPEKDVNWELISQFHEVIDFWMQEHGVDGFRLDVPQSLNKNFDLNRLEFEDLLYGNQAVRVLNALFGGTDCFLMMECFDPTYGEITQYYLDNTPVDFVLNVALKDKIADGEGEFLHALGEQVKNPGFMLDLESHDSPRFISRGATPEDMVFYMFNTRASALCLYQGQELALDNPTEEELPGFRMVELAAPTKMRFRSGELIRDLRPTSRANARVVLPRDEYARQEEFPSSYLNLTKKWIDYWRKN